jgi:hypothetical protein
MNRKENQRRKKIKNKLIDYWNSTNSNEHRKKLSEVNSERMKKANEILKIIEDKNMK